MNILAIGAHPDDIEIGCGGLLIKAVRNGHSVYLYNLTRGEKAGLAEKRTEELKRTARYIGARALYIDRFPDTGLSLTSDLINHIESCINVCKPDLVICFNQGIGKGKAAHDVPPAQVRRRIATNECLTRQRSELSMNLR